MHPQWSLLAVFGAPLLATLVGTAVLVARAAQVPTLVRGPYLQMLSPNGVSVLWRTDGPAACALAIRPLSGPTRIIDGSTATDCALEVDGLAPGTGYAYTPLADGVPLDAEAVFRTDDPSRPFSFLVLGDSGSGGAKQYAVRDRMLATPADFILHTGDMIYQDGAPEDFDRKLFRPYRALLRKLVLWPTLGNHDVHIANGAAWYDAFRTPANNAVGTEGYYSFDFGNAHVVVLDTTRASGPGSAQRQFLEQDLAASTATWNFVAFHHTLYSSGLQHGSDLGRRANLLPVLDQYGVDVVFMGHEHSYERTVPLRNDVELPPEQGTTYVTTGGGGFSLHAIGPAMSFTQHVESSFHFVRVAIDGAHLFGQMIREDGTVGDTFTIAKGVVPPPPTCGDDLVNAAEQCDGDDSAACAGRCAPDCTCLPVCGDGRVNRAEEECDGGDAPACPDLCLADCRCDDGAHFVALDAVADTVVKPGPEAGWDHGGMETLGVDAAPRSVVYLKFDLSAVDKLVVRATLRMVASNGSFDGGTVYPVRDASWIEGTANPGDPAGPGLKWTEVDGNADDVLNEHDTSPFAPMLDRRIGALVSVVGSPTEVDVTAAFQEGPGLYALALMNDASNGATYGSREHPDPAQRPRLRLEIGDLPPTTTTTTTWTTTTTISTTSTTSSTSTTTTTSSSSSSTSSSTSSSPSTSTSSSTSTSLSASTSTSTTTTTSSTLPPAEVCSGGLDEDQDGFTDCADRDCAESASCSRGCAAGAEWESLACRFTVLAADVDSRLEPRRLRAQLAAKLKRAASARVQAEESCAAGQERRARVALRAAGRALGAFRRRLDSPAGRQAIGERDRDAWRMLAAQMRLDVDVLRAVLDCGS